MDKSNKIKMSVKKEENAVATPSEKGHIYLQCLIAILVNSSSITYGLQVGWVSPVMKLLRSEDSPLGSPMTDSEIAWMTSILFLSPVISSPLYSLLVDMFGRKKGILSIVVPQALCWIVTYFASNAGMLIAARALGGFAAGGVFNVIPMYVKEISQDNIRGILGSIIVLFQNIGTLIIYALGSYLPYYTVLYIVGGLPIIMLFLLLLVPESPAYLIKIGKHDRAASVLAMLRGVKPDHGIVQKEIENIKKQDEFYKSIPSTSMVAIFKVKAWRRGFIMMLVMMAIRGLSGALLVTSYAASLLTSSGITLSPELQALSIPAVMIPASLISMSVIDKFGRKPILTTAYILASASLLAVGGAEAYRLSGGSPPGWLTVAGLAGSVAAYAFGVSPVPYVMLAEMFNFQIRAKVLGCIVTFGWFIAFVQLIIFAPLASAFGAHAAYFFYAAVNLCGIAATLVVPETKEKTIEQIEAELGK